MRQLIVNAFENGPFTGNPAAVVPLESWPDDALMQQIAAQNNLSETAFFVDLGAVIELRWFTPTAEIELCGHATLATAHVLYAELGDEREELRFETLSGTLVVKRTGEAYSMDFPASTLEVVAEGSTLAGDVLRAAGAEHGEVRLGDGRAYLMLDRPELVCGLDVDLELVSQLPRGDLFVSAPGEDGYDIFTRVFAPGLGIPEDPATGAAHCGFAPYWCERLGSQEITSKQVSKRGGYFLCRWRKEQGRVDLVGSCRTFSRGEIEV